MNKGREGWGAFFNVGPKGVSKGGKISSMAGEKNSHGSCVDVLSKLYNIKYGQFNGEELIY